MGRLQRLLQRRAAAHDECVAISAKIEAEDRLTADENEKKALATYEAEIVSLDEEIKREEALAAREKTMSRKSVNTEFAEAAEKAAGIKVTENFEKDPMKGFKSPREFIGLVMDAGKRGATSDNRLKFLATAGSDEQSTFSDSYGGFFVPEGMSPGVLKIDAEPDPFEGRVTRIPMATTSVKFHARVDKAHSSSVSGGLTVSRRAEASDGTSSRVVHEQVKLEANTLFGLAYATEELLTDSPESFAAIIAAGFNDEFTARLIDERINGTGVGEFVGVLKSPALISIAKETGQAAGTIVYDNIIKARARCWGYRNAVWVGNHNVIPQLAKLNQAVGTGGALVWAPSALTDVPDMLMGRPFITTEFAPSLGTVGDLMCLNMTQYLEGLYQPLQSAESMHVRFVAHERTFKFWLRNAGAPWWKSVLTPKNGDTLSPFVAIASR